jgi:CRP-like cAMP-binding protein
MSNSPNLLLASLPDADFDLIRPHLKTLEIKLGAILVEPKARLNRVYFPHSGIISLVVQMVNGENIETAMIGRDGAFGAALALDGSISLNRATVQLAGIATVIDHKKMLEFGLRCPSFRSIIIQHDEVLFAEAQQSAACNAVHTVEARMCRWLLRMRDLADSDELPLTQDFFAHMLGVRRTSISVSASALLKAKYISYTRGNVRILNIEGLRAASCECYGAVKTNYTALAKQERVA